MAAVVKILVLFLTLLCTASARSVKEKDSSEAEESPEPVDLSGNGRSFFFLGTLFRRWRDRWLAFHNPDPFYAGSAYPINGYYNCPPYGCNPTAIQPQPGYYPGGYYATPLQQQQAAQGNSNVYIYQTDQNTPTAITGGPPGGFLGPGPGLPAPLTPQQPPGYGPIGPRLPPPGPVQPSLGFGYGCVPPSAACAMAG